MSRARIALLAVLLACPLGAATRYDISSGPLQDTYVDPVNGSDGNSGASRSGALRTLTEAWNRIPRGTPLATGHRILMMAGRHGESTLPNYMEERYGTAAAPIIIQSADASRSARLAGDLNIFDVRYLYLIGLDMRPDPAGDVLHCEKCDHLLVRESNLDGGDRQAHEVVKINQSQHVFIEDSTLSGADDNTIDFVAVQYGHVIGNRISDAQDWCMYAKGGSAYLTVEGNEIFDCGTGGFTAGQGTGFQFMTPPWIHYEAYDVKVVNNVIHDTEGAGLGVNGGYDILLAYNTLHRVGTRSHMLEVTYGARSCDGVPGDEGRERCQQYLALGGWGTTVIDDGTNYVRIPNRNVFVYDNLLYNPPGFVSPQIFTIAGPFEDVVADANLQIRGNVIFNGGESIGVGDGSGCAPSNPTCNETQILADNTINQFEPEVGGDLRPRANSNLLTARAFAIPDFTWDDAPRPPLAPAGRLENRVTTDRDGTLRATPSVPGAYTTGAAIRPARRRSVRH
ncbi:MAG TPA: right-handed parallel beta-helix repeat-containing protein [Thermoanaerobaculia bacterium]|nr:right-handed parallel beta-helix repeat-containing protein [Thermoanaerobaculia bacterium]